jgi:hypothetical protein
LAVELVADGRGNLRIGFGERSPERGRGLGGHVFSAAAIWSRRRWWRPPSNVVSSHTARISSRGRRRRCGRRARARWRRCAPRQPRGVEVVAERGADAGDFVGGDLLALSAAADHDAAVGAALGHGPPDRQADRRIVHCRFAVGAVVVDGVPEALQRVFEMFFEQESRVIGADRHPHDGRLYYVVRGSSFVVRRSRAFAANHEPRTSNHERL